MPLERPVGPEAICPVSTSATRPAPFFASRNTILDPLIPPPITTASAVCAMAPPCGPLQHIADDCLARRYSDMYPSRARIQCTPLLESLLPCRRYRPPAPRTTPAATSAHRRPRPQIRLAVRLDSQSEGVERVRGILRRSATPGS